LKRAIFDAYRPAFSSPAQVAFESGVFSGNYFYSRRVKRTSVNAKTATGAFIFIYVGDTGRLINTNGHVWQRTG
jgi:hypothetical protein